MPTTATLWLQQKAVGGPDKISPPLIQDAGVAERASNCSRQPALQQGLGAMGKYTLLLPHLAVLGHASSKTYWEVVMWA